MDANDSPSEKQRSMSSPSLPPNSTGKIATLRTRLLIGCYRVENFADVEVSMRAFVAVFMRYPEEVVIAVTEPATGIPAKLKWPPSIAEVVAACDAELAPMLRQLRRDQIAFEQRTGITSALPPQERPTADEIKAKLKGFGPSEDTDADLRERRQSLDAGDRAKTERLILRQYAQLNQDPIYCSDDPAFRLPVSPSLAKLIKETTP